MEPAGHITDLPPGPAPGCTEPPDSTTAEEPPRVGAAILRTALSGSGYREVPPEVRGPVRGSVPLPEPGAAVSANNEHEINPPPMILIDTILSTLVYLVIAFGQNIFR